jgi:decaprenylphospho-beta-D-erythro-pentofuranosid-2-ulose 2-reductase
MMNKHIVIIGATSAIAEHCARTWLAEAPAKLTLVGRNLEKLQAIKNDLQVRYPKASIDAQTTNFFDPKAIQTFVTELATVAPIDIALVAHGFLPEQKECEQDLELCNETLQINGISPILFAEAFANILEKQNQGTLAIISSVAGDRGRKSNYVYGAGKAIVNTYIQGLQHRFGGHPNIHIAVIKPGPTDTPMTTRFKQKGMKMATPQNVANVIVHSLENKKSTIYAPKQWKYIMGVVKHIPSFVFNKTNL